MTAAKPRIPSITELMKSCPKPAPLADPYADAICGTREEQAAAPRPVRKTSTKVDHGPYVPGQTIAWELVNCGRCGGGGQYSIGTCFGCNGSGRVHSRAAATAKKLWEDTVKDLGAVTYGELSVGDKIRQPGTIYSKWTVVTEVGTCSSASILPDGTRVPHIRVTTQRYGSMSAPADMYAGVRPLTVEEATEAWAVLRHRKGLTRNLPA